MKISLDCFNSKDGAGLFTGVERYNVLAGRLPLAAVQARDMHGFWANLMRKMRWEMPPKAADQKIAQALLVDNPAATIKALATEAVSIITIARMLHDADKETRRAIHAGLTGAEAPADFNDSLEGI